MKKVFLAAAFALAAFLSPVSAQQLVQNFIEVRGRGEVEVEPNKFKVLIEIDEAARKGKFSVAEVEGKMISALKRIGVDTKNALVMNDMNSSVQKKDQMTKAQYTLSLSSTEQLNKAFAALKDLGITKMDITEATHSNIADFQAEARKKAILVAREKAQQLSDAMGRELGECYQIQDYSSNYVANQPYMLKSRSAEADEGGSASNIDFRKIKVSADLEARFILPLSEEARKSIVM